MSAQFLAGSRRALCVVTPLNVIIDEYYVKNTTALLAILYVVIPQNMVGVWVDFVTFGLNLRDYCLVVGIFVFFPCFALYDVLFQIFWVGKLDFVNRRRAKEDKGKYQWYCPIQATWSICGGELLAYILTKLQSLLLGLWIKLYSEVVQLFYYRDHSSSADSWY